ERILLHVQRPPLRYGLVPFLRRKVHDGILVVTDRQVLFLADVLPPGSAYVDWGYLARTIALERIVDVAAVRADPYPRLQVSVEATGGNERLDFDFTADALSELEHAAAVLQAFTPQAQGRQLRRRPYVAKELPSLSQEAEEPEPAELLEKLEGRLKGQLAAGEYALAQALAPAWPATKTGPRLLAVTERRFFIVPENGTAPMVFDLAAIASLQIRHSLLGSHLAIAVPGEGEVHRTTVDFDFPTAGRFLKLFRTARQLLSTPLRESRDGVAAAPPEGGGVR
ncbi:MAG: hypothetical protein ACYC1C_20345, partial [Chloroflexota bacterium]